MKYDFRHIDPRTGLPKVIDDKNEIQMMNRLPWKSDWIYILQNRIGLNTVGNIRYKKKLWYDHRDRTVSSDRTKEDAQDIRSYVLPGAGRPGGWIFASQINEHLKTFINKKHLNESNKLSSVKNGSVIICWTNDESCKYPYIGTVINSKQVGVYTPGAGNEIGCYLDFDTISQWDYIDNVFPNKHLTSDKEDIFD